MRVAVLYGGISRERDISISSGTRVYEALKKLGYDASLIDVDEDFLKRVWNLRNFDVVFPMLHGYFGEDGSIQGVLEYLGVPYVGSGVQESSLCFDKLRTYQILKDVVNVPKYVVIRRPTDKSPFGFPCFIKPRREGSSIGAHICHNERELWNFSKRELGVYDDLLLMEYIKGREMTVSVIEIDGVETILPILELKPEKEFYDYEAKYTKGMTKFIIPAPVNEDLKKVIESQALTAYKNLGCKSFARIDGILRDGIFYFLEANSIPGMTETSDLPASAEAFGYSFETLVSVLLKSASLKIPR